MKVKLSCVVSNLDGISGTPKSYSCVQYNLPALKVPLENPYIVNCSYMHYFHLLQKVSHQKIFLKLEGICLGKSHTSKKTLEVATMDFA